jgi:tRNA pseudouridine38-40 synthase
MRFRLTLEYDGANYSGWQLQQGQGSIQACIEAALSQLFNQPIRIYGSGRTDAGVHARGQVAAFTAPRAIDALELRRALNALLPPDIAVPEALVVADDFDPRRSARSRIYEYRILNRPLRSAFAFRDAWLVREPLDQALMQEAAALFVGEHDFAALRTLGSEEKTTVRRVMISEWRRAQNDILVYRVEATAFLRHMVRTMVALMAEVGRGKLPPGAVTTLVASRDRAQAPATAPACGLCLMEVRY